jgi:RNA polymerase sigma factor (TIGR02999 family)
VGLTGRRRTAKIARTDVQPGPAAEVTALLHAWSEGDLEARERLMPIVYADLRRRAAACMRGERLGHTLQPTALVHETYLRLIEQRSPAWQNRAQFFAVAAEMMRRILVDRARAHRAGKRSGQWARVSLDPAHAVAEPADVSLLDLDAALERLAEFDSRKSQIAVMRFFGGLSLDEMADVLDLSARTVERDWQAARAWLFKALSSIPGRT